MKKLNMLAAMTIGLALGGCGEYAVPTQHADNPDQSATQPSQLPDATEMEVQELMDKRPKGTLPGAIAVVRVQPVGDCNDSYWGSGGGEYQIVTERDIEDPAEVEKWQAMPQILGIAPMGKMLLPREKNSERDLRRAAAELHADFILIYTVDSTISNHDLAGLATICTLGLAPDQSIQSTSTISAVLLDTRTGAVFGVCEATEHCSELTIGWMTEAGSQDAQQHSEKAAFKSMSRQFQMLWGRILKGA